MVQAEIITIGDEILIGQVVDTNSTFIAQELGKIGVSVYQITSISDEKQSILNVLTEASKRVQLVIITGGLGPTNDDITKEVLCEFMNDKLIRNEAVEKNILSLFRKYNLNLPLPVNLQQAMVPSKGRVLMNRHGTAPGIWLEHNKVTFFSLPGVPYEMRNLLQEQVLPEIIKKFKRPYIYHKTLMTYGLGESALAERISEWENSLPENVKLAYLPALGKVRLRLSSNGNNKEKLEKKIDSLMSELQEKLSDIAVGLEDETSIVQRIGKVLSSKKQFFSVAESCTGGKIAEEITRNAGVSPFFKGGIIPYETELKTKILGVPKEIIDTYNVVSIEVAEVMATQCNKLFDSEYAIATTGIAGPTKGDGDKEIGTVCIAIATPEGVVSERFMFGKDRFRVMEKATTKGLEMLWKEIIKI